MAKHIVKCRYCKKEFDAQKPEENKLWIQPKPKFYYHYSCWQEIKKEEEKEFELYDYIKSKFGAGYDYVKLRRQIEGYRDRYNYTYSGILKSLQWYYDIKKNPVKRIDTLGIIPYIYEDAKKYFYKIYLAQKANEDLKTIEIKEETVKIKKPKYRYKAQKKLIEWGEE